MTNTGRVDQNGRMSDNGAIAVLDVGGTTTKIGAVRSLDQVVAGTPLPTLADGSRDEVLDRLAQACRAAIDLTESSLRGVAIAFPGPFDVEAGVPRIRGLHKFESVHGVELRTELQRRCDLGDVPIRFARDNEAIGVGEAWVGAGRGAGRVLTVALGTGMAACLTDDGQVVEYVDAVQVERLYERMTPYGRADDMFSARGLAGLLGITPDRLAAEVDAHPSTVDEFGRRLGTFLEPIAERGSVDLIVIGGGLAASFPAFGTGLAHASGRPCRPAAGGSSALVGAAVLAFPERFPRPHTAPG